jgi:hypothetical protein
VLGLLAQTFLGLRDGLLWGVLMGLILAPFIPVPGAGCGVRRPEDR